MPSLSRFAGWKKGVVVFIFSCTTTFGINLAFVIWAVLRGRKAPGDGSYTLNEGSGLEDCRRLRQVDTAAHFLINLLSTIILGGSNYCMQCLSAPTRGDINKAHSKGRYLDIGVPSLHNLGRISGRRAWLWMALGLSSWPLHLFYNSAMYKSTSSNNYLVFSAGRGFVNDNELPQKYQEASSYSWGSWNFYTVDTNHSGTPAQDRIEVALRIRREASKTGVANLTAAECVRAYTQPFLSGYRNVLMVTDNKTQVLHGYQAEWDLDYSCGNSQPFQWTCTYLNKHWERNIDCDVPCDRTDVVSRMESDATSGRWRPFQDSVMYCLAEKSEEICRLQFNLPIAIAVVGLNFIKICLMVCTLSLAFGQSEIPLLTTGDAIKSFLEEPDPATRSRCLLSRDMVHRDPANCLRSLSKPNPLPYTPRRLRWGSAVSGRRWGLCIMLYLIALGIALYWLGKGLAEITTQKDIQSLWRMGIGSVSGPGGGSAIVTSDDTFKLSLGAQLLKWVILANLAQLILSLLYYTYNGLFTTMLMAHEWSSYAVKRKGLRIASTVPDGEQRDSYFLQLPYRWSLPLILFSTITHWLISQSTFLVSIDMTDYHGQLLDEDTTRMTQLRTLGYSPIAIILTVCVGALLVVMAIGVGLLRRFDSGMPVAASNSMAIAAACHLGDGELHETDVASQKLQWGATGPCDITLIAASDELKQPAVEVQELVTLNPRLKNSSPMQDQQSLLQHDQTPSVDTHSTEYWHCAFSAHATEEPTSGRLYM